MTVTIKDLIEAIRKNGYPQIKGHFFDYDNEGKIVAACALGQAAINLNVSADALATGYDYYRRDFYNGIVSIPKFADCPKIIVLNDNYGLSLEEIANRLEIWAKSFNTLNDVIPHVKKEYDGYYS